MSEQLLLVGLPRSGSSWLYNCIAACLPTEMSTHEFFNPFLNGSSRLVVVDRPHRRRLADAFGSDCYSLSLEHPNGPIRNHRVKVNITIPWQTQPDLEQIYMDTWAQTEYRFTKEVWSFLKLGFLTQKFTCVGLWRAGDLTIPGSIEKLTSLLYLTLFESFLHTYWMHDKLTQTIIDFILKKATRGQERVWGSHYLASLIMRRECQQHQIRILDLEQLIQKSEIELIDYLQVPLVRSDQLAREIVKTRNPAFLENARGRFRDLGIDNFVQELSEVC